MNDEYARFCQWYEANRHRLALTDDKGRAFAAWRAGQAKAEKTKEKTDKKQWDAQQS